MPAGIWAMDTDGTGVGSIAVEPCGTTGNGLHLKGRGFTLWGADVAAAVMSQLQPVDATPFRGISFVVRSAFTTPLIVKVQAPYSQPACAACDEFGGAAGNECYSGYVVIANTTLVPLPQLVRWSDFAQQMWGYRAMGTRLFDPGNFVSIAFAFEQNVDFDVCLDDVKLVP